MKIKKEVSDKLRCISGLCDHDCMDKKCLYNKIIDCENSSEKMYDELVKLFEKELNSNGDRKSK